MILRKGAAAVVTKNLEISYLLDFYGDVLTEKQRDVMEQYYNDDLSLSEIADNFGITRQGVRDAIKRGEEVIACVAPAFVGQFGKEATPPKIKAAMRILGFKDVVEVAIGADLCTVEEAHDFLENVPAKQPFMGTSCCPAWSVMAKKLFPQFKDYISMALTPMVITARMVKKDHPNAIPF